MTFTSTSSCSIVGSLVEISWSISLIAASNTNTGKQGSSDIGRESVLQIRCSCFHHYISGSDKTFGIIIKKERVSILTNFFTLELDLFSIQVRNLMALINQLLDHFLLQLSCLLIVSLRLFEVATRLFLLRTRVCLLLRFFLHASEGWLAFGEFRISLVEIRDLLEKSFAGLVEHVHLFGEAA